MNNVLGEPFEGEGNSITGTILARCSRDYELSIGADETIAGVDVGAVLHVHISTITKEGNRRKVFVGTVPNFEELDRLWTRYKIRRMVIDALPETHSVKKFVRSHAGAMMCYYRTTSDKKITPKPDFKNRTITVDRTESLDASYADFCDQKVELPLNWRTLDNGDFLAQMKAPVRLHDEARGVFVWDEGNRPDHHRHADNYEKIANKLYGSGESLIEVA